MNPGPEKELSPEVRENGFVLIPEVKGEVDTCVSMQVMRVE